VLEDGIPHLQDVAGYAQVLRDPWDGGHAKIYQNLGYVPHQNRQPPNLGDAFHLGVLKGPRELDELHQLLVVVLGVESLGLRLHPCRLA
jgi:hypothetical protein